MTLNRRIEQGLIEYGLADQVAVIPRCIQYLELLARWNQVTNLTGVSDLEDMVSAHLLDSLSVWSFIRGQSVLDVGAGAGLPGIPLALFMPDKNFILLDSNGKKARFMTQAAIDLKLHNVSVVQQRIENCRDSFDQIVCRAFASLDELVELCLPRLNPGGNLLAMKGPSEVERIDAGKMTIHELQVPGLNRHRYLIEVRR